MNVDENSMNVDENSMNVDENSMNVDENSMNVDENSMNVKKKSINIKKKIFKCIECNKIFKKKSYLDIHLKKNCKMNINFNNIYTFNNYTFGKNKYGKDGGDIYIIQTDHNFNNIFKIGKTVNLYNRLNDYRCGSVIEPRLYFYYPFKNIKKTDKDIKFLLKNYNLKREIYNCDLKVIRNIILKYQKKVDKCNIENEPLIKQTDITQCKYCNNIFYTKKIMFDHLKNCLEYRNSFIEKTSHIFKCKLCNTNFSHKNSYYRHMKHYCKKEKNNLEENKSKLELEQEIEELKEQVDKLKMSQHITNNINVIAYNKNPDVSHLTNSDYLKIMNRGFNSVPKLIEAIHYNPDKPENQNVYIPNIKNNYAMVWNGDKWDLNHQDQILEDMYDDKSNLLIEKLEEFEELDSQENEKEVRVLKKFRRFVDSKENDKIKNKIKGDIKLLLYNKKKLVKST